MEEIWKDIEGYEGYYQVSNKGRIKSLARNIYNKCGKFQRYKKENIKVLKTNSYGYHTITLSVNKNDFSIGVHRLVAQAFISNPENKSEVNHIDCDRKNNSVENLEWCTHHENILYTIQCGNKPSMVGSKNPNYGNTKLKEYFKEHPEEKIKQARPNGQNGRAKKVKIWNEKENINFDCIKECAEWFHFNFKNKITVKTVIKNIKYCNENNKKYFDFNIEII